uniref:Uncharacterized protein n=1 Tax=Mastacembelus armatus TaxID=205130 RepID=A0A3Q3MRV3_9TELE
MVLIRLPTLPRCLNLLALQTLCLNHRVDLKPGRAHSYTASHYLALQTPYEVGGQDRGVRLWSGYTKKIELKKHLCKLNSLLFSIILQAAVYS